MSRITFLPDSFSITSGSTTYETNLVISSTTNTVTLNSAIAPNKSSGGCIYHDTLSSIRAFAGPNVYGPWVMSKTHWDQLIWETWELLDYLETITVGRIFIQKTGYDLFSFYFEKFSDFDATTKLKFQTKICFVLGLEEGMEDEIAKWMIDNLSARRSIYKVGKSLSVSLESIDDIALFKLKFGHYIEVAP